MSTELQAPEDADAARAALDELLTSHDECNEFFGDVFDQIQALSLELFARQKCQELNSGQQFAADATVAACREEFSRATDQIRQLSTGIGSQLADLTAVANEIAKTRENPANEAQIAAILENVRCQQADWIQQRSAFEAEIETLRAHAVEQEEALHEQKRLAARQQAELAGELKRMRSLMEALTGHVRVEPAASGGNSGDGKRAPPVDAFMLDSVLAQYQMLQRDNAARGIKRNGEPGPAGALPDASIT